MIIKNKKVTEPLPGTEEHNKAMEEWKKVEHKHNRLKEYPTSVEQHDMQYWDKINGTNIWEETITAIKNKYPKVGS
tara:strand:+ start:339 stop:566 length:228 start_codon:yes stop_codon:yes gene_type:complete